MTSSSPDLLAVAVRAARAGAEALMERFGGPVRGLETKSTATDPVSDADRAAEDAVLSVLRRERPDDGIVSEEGGSAESRSGLRWVVDPLDGTVNYLYSIPHWAVSVAVEDEEDVLVGVVLDPLRQELFTATRGGGAQRNGAPIQVSDAASLDGSLIATGFGYDPVVRIEQADILTRFIGRARDVRRAGTASLDLVWTACARLDGYYESGLKPWDLAAGGLIVREAGGRLGQLPRPIASDPGVVASAPGIWEELNAALREAMG
ncbi:MAG TPA: inositol monophosphatase family protein [Actinomycetota bacterium]|nr:inositol monophosphatase family protein [Actinomycetota bacterium]